MKRRFASALLILSTLALPACGQSMKKPDIKLNPHPKMRYEITLTIEDAPGPLESVSGFMQYEVANERDCVPADAISGHHQRLSIDPAVEFKRVENSQTYKGTVYLDLVHDSDYYDLGVCRWKMVGFSAVMKAGEVTFNPFISGEQVAKLKLTTQYFPKSYFGDPSVIKDTHTGGMPMSELVARAPDNFFSTTLSVKESFQ